MKNQKNIEKNIDFLIIILFIFPFFKGINEIHIVLSMDLLLIVALTYKIVRNRCVHYTLDFKFFAIIAFVLCYLISSIYSPDKTNALLGFLKFSTIPLFLFLVIQYNLTREEKSTLLNTVSVSGAVMVIASIIAISMGKNDIFYNNRLSGFFFYANSFAMWLLSGIVITACKEKLKIFDFTVIAILAVGIILTNSRSITVLSAITYIMIIIIKKNNRKKLLINAVVIFISGFITYYILSKIGIFSRIITGTSSEGLLRLLYYKDALRMIKENIFGYGYMSWWYMQPAFQTGVYYSMYIHNSLLQIVFDAGLIPALLVIYIFIRGFFDKKSNLTEKILMIIILGHAVIDFDIEFMAITLLVFLTLNFDKLKETRKILPLEIFSVFIFLIYGYFYIITLSNNNSNYVMANDIYPFWSQTQEAELANVDDFNKKVEIAFKVQKLNKYYKQTYYIISEDYLHKGDYENAYIYQKEILSLEKYNKNVYLEYIEFLKRAINYYSGKENYDKTIFYAEKLLEVPEIIDNVIEKSDSLAFKIEHKPDLELPYETLQYIEQIKSKIR